MRFFTLPLASAVFLLSAAALATPTVTISPTIQRYEPDGMTTAPGHAMPAGTQGLNHNDCANDVQINFLLTMTPDLTGMYSLQAWAGTSDCGLATSRTSSTAACWPLRPGSIPGSTTATVPIKVRDIVSQIGLSGPSINLSYAPASPNVCNAASAVFTGDEAGTTTTTDEGGSSAGSGISAVSVYFMWVQNAATDDVAEASFPFMAKLAGPAAPSGVTVNAGDTLLKIGWTPSVDPTLAGFEIFTDPPIGGMAMPIPWDATPYPVTTCDDAGLSDGGFDEAGNPLPGQPLEAGCSTDYVTPINPNVGSDGGSGGTCGVSVLGSGQSSTQLASYMAQNIGGSTNASYTVTGLTNGTTYNVAVSATDNYDNIGPLSAISTSTCGIPAPVDDFWKIYREDGGTAGGSCALAGVGEAAKTPIFGVALVGLMALYWKRRRT